MGKKAKKVNHPKSQVESINISTGELTLQERLTLEKKNWKAPKPREVAKEALKLWMSVPSIFLGDGMPDELKIEDEDLRWIMSVTTQKAFAELVGVEEPVISKWKRELLKDTDSFKETKAFMRRLTKNVLGALYKMAIKEADAARVKLWAQLVESWKETGVLEHQQGDDLGLTPEERKQLDKLLAQNTK